MHTDEYEISLSRELRACEKEIGNIKRNLLSLEEKYNIKSEELAGKFAGGTMSVQDAGLIAWMKETEALKKWETLRAQYAALLETMKI